MNRDAVRLKTLKQNQADARQRIKCDCNVVLNTQIQINNILDRLAMEDPDPIPSGIDREEVEGRDQVKVSI